MLAADARNDHRRVRQQAQPRFATIASNTGCTSVGELAMTLRISAVAVCRSSASLVSLNRRTFSIAITAWSAKVLQQLDCVLGERRRLAARDADRADRLALAQHRHDERCCESPASTRHSRASPDGSRDRVSISAILYRGFPSIARPPRPVVGRGRAGIDPQQRLVPPIGDSSRADQVNHVANDARHDGSNGRRSRRIALSTIASNTGCTSDGELAMTLQNLRRRRLPLERLAQSRCAPQLLNRRTFSIAITAWSAKVLSRGNLHVREGTHLQSAHEDQSDGGAFAQQRHGEQRLIAESLLVTGTFGKLRSGFGRRDVEDVHELAFQHRAAGRRAPG